MLPIFRSLAGAAPLFLEPPFVSSNLSMRYLPIAADPASLGKFVEAYLRPGGSLPEEMGHFRPCAPYVMVIVATHPHLASETDDTWLSQHELAFSIPLIHESGDSGDRHARLAWTQPFVFLDSAVGLATGRQIWGWPKAMAEFPVWASDWNGVQAGALVRMQMPMPSKVTGPQRMEPVLEIVRTPFEPGSLISGARRGFTEFGRAIGSFFGSEEQADERAVGASLRRVGELGAEGWARALQVPPVLDSDVATLQQFRDIEEPDLVSYQALVRSTMQTERIRSFRWVGLERMMCGDPTGGIRLRIADHPTQPIVSKLGLLADEIEDDDAGRCVSTFSPLWPMEVVADIRYGMGHVACWRRRGTGWLRPLAGPDASPVPFPDQAQPAPARYDMARGEATQAEPPPFEGGLADVFQLELPAKTDALRELICRWLDGFPAAEIVTVPTDANVSLGLSRSIEDPAHTWVSFRVPIDIMAEDGGTERGFVAPFEYTSRATEAITGQEVEGRRIAAAHIEVVDAAQGLPVAWRVQSQLASAPGCGLEAVYRDVAQISLSEVANGQDEANLSEVDHGAHASFERSRLSLFQLPSTAYGGRAVVQSLVLAPVGASAIEPVRPIAGEVWLTSYPSQSIADVLGLEATETGDGGHLVKAKRGIHFRLRSRTGRGRRLPSG